MIEKGLLCSCHQMSNKKGSETFAGGRKRENADYRQVQNGSGLRSEAWLEQAAP